MRTTGIQIFIFLKLERNSTINHAMTLKSTVSSPLLDQISVLLSDAARNINNEKRIFISKTQIFKFFGKTDLNMPFSDVIIATFTF